MPLFSLPHGQLEIVQGDVTRIPADAIVNAANSHLSGGGGVDGAIHRAGGPGIMRELDEIRSRIGTCSTGSAVVTGAGRLPARFVFHAVGPIYRGGNNHERELLASCYKNCLDLAVERGVATITFPSISTGVYGYPVAEAAAVAVETIHQCSAQNECGPTLIKLVQFSSGDHAIYREAAELLGSRDRAHA